MIDFQRKSSVENYRREISQSDQEKRYKDALKASLKDFNIPIGSWKQTAQNDRSKWRGLINKRAALYEKIESVKLKESAESAKPISTS